MTRTITLDTTPSLPATFAKAVAGGRGRHGGPLPDLEVVQRGVRVDWDRLAAYDHVCGWTLRDAVPSTYLHVLTFPLQASLFADKAYPYSMVGSVHVTNTITQHRPVRGDEALDLRVRPANARVHRRGVLVDLLGEVRVGDELVWEGVSSYLYRGAKLADGAAAEEPRHTREELVDGPGAIWRLPADLGRQYAAVSGDVNPIHLHPLTAKAMGFPRTIVHGMWSKARMLGDLENRLPDAYVATVEFRKPVLLPSTVKFVAQSGPDAGLAMALRSAKSGDVHAFGSVRPLGSNGSIS